jgi:anti-sigma B factor antagonist
MTSFVTREDVSGATIIQPTGRLDMLAAPQLKSVVGAAVASGKTPVVVDLAGVDFLDSSGLGALISGLRATRQVGSDLRIAAAAAQVLAVLKLTNIDRIIPPYRNVEDALQGG